MINMKIVLSGGCGLWTGIVAFLKLRRFTAGQDLATCSFVSDFSSSLT